MSNPIFTLSAFGDEIDADLATQLDVLLSEGVHHLELRAAWGKNVLDLDAGELQRARALLDERGFTVSAIGSPIGKSHLDHRREFEVERLERSVRVADVLGTRLIRIFSFYLPTPEPERYTDEVLARMTLLARRAEAEGVVLLHENEKEIYGDVPSRCAAILAAANSPALRNAFDPANYVQCGVRPMDEAWPLLADATTHIHIKDAVFADGSVRPAGEGDGQVPELLAALVQRGYEGFVVLEPHLQIAGPSGGYSGEAGMRVAVRALRRLLVELPNVAVR
ncbi:MAG: sugar phosphate isomerase/epimerase [Anaerolineae bacterium]|nr:sugar phosphate isomerase/epimerase [Anaerolineae bacterium]